MLRLGPAAASIMEEMDEGGSHGSGTRVPRHRCRPAGARRRSGHLPDGIPRPSWSRRCADADLLLMCYTPVTARVIEGSDPAQRHRQIRGRHRCDRHPGRDAARHSGRQRARIRRGDRRRRRLRADDRAGEAAAGHHPRPSQEDGWIWPAQRWLGRDIAGATLGLVGCGRIGRSMARMAGQGFRARVLGFDPHVDAPRCAPTASRRSRPARDAPGLRFRLDPLRPERRNARPDRPGRTRLPEDRRRSSSMSRAAR